MRRHDHLLLDVFASPGSTQRSGETSDLTPLVPPRLDQPERLPLGEFLGIALFEELLASLSEGQRQPILESPPRAA